MTTVLLLLILLLVCATVAAETTKRPSTVFMKAPMLRTRARVATRLQRAGMGVRDG